MGLVLNPRAASHIAPLNAMFLKMLVSLVRVFKRHGKT